MFFVPALSFFFLNLLTTLFTPHQALAADYQQCNVSSTCTVGEFLYDDDYTPLSGATCTLTIKNPDGTAFLTNEPLTEAADAWYSKDVSIGTTEGLYRANICCSSGSDYLCLDKSITVLAGASALTAADIWNYSNRTLSSYGNLVADVWGYSSRSLSSFGNLAADVWDYSNRSLTSFGTLIADIWSYQPDSSTPTSTQSLSSIATEQEVQRELIEKLVNSPVVSLSLNDTTNIPDLTSKIKSSKVHANALFDTVKSAKSRLLVLSDKWGQLNSSAIEQEIAFLSNIFGESEALASLSKDWDTPVMQSLNKATEDFQSSLSSLLANKSSGKTPPAALSDALTDTNTIEDLIGDITTETGQQTLFGYLAFVQARNSQLESESQKLAALLENWNGQGEQLLQKEVTGTSKRLLAINQYPGGAKIVKPLKLGGNIKQGLKNTVFSLQALLGLNRQLLAARVNDPIRSLWLEEGSIIFRAVITNPSSIISQSVPLKFYLPKELKTDDIITLDPSLKSQYDPTEEALFVSGTYELGPEETEVVFVEVQDAWQLSLSEIESLKKQANELLQPLEKTAFFGQGTILKSDIEVTLEKVLVAQNKAVTPENRIRAYREAKLELSSVNTNIMRLEDLVAQASNTGSIFGFVGGVQAIAVWGILVIVVAAFVFLTIYMRQLNGGKLNTSLIKPKTQTTEVKQTNLVSAWNNLLKKPIAIPLIIVVTSLATIVLTQAVLSLTRKQTPTVLQTSPLNASPSPTTPSPSPLPLEREEVTVDHEKEVLGETGVSPESVYLQVPEGSSINVRNKPDISADLVLSLKASVDIYLWENEGDWTRISLSPEDKNNSWWIHSQFLN
jgi:hypothetical protein